MTYLLIAIIVIALLAIAVVRIRRLRPKQLTPVALANQLLRQPERFFIIVPWYLARCRRSKLDPLRFMEEAAACWAAAGNLGLPALTLIAFAKLQSEPTRANLQNLLSLLFGDEANPIERAANEPGCNQRLAIKCLEVMNLDLIISGENRNAKRKKLPDPNEIKNLLQSAENAEKAKSKLTISAFGDFNDAEILDDWRKLLLFSATYIDPDYKKKSKLRPFPEQNTSARQTPRDRVNGPEIEPNRDIRGKDERDPSNQGYPYLWFIMKAVKNSHAEAEK